MGRFWPEARPQAAADNAGILNRVVRSDWETVVFEHPQGCSSSPPVLPLQ